VDFRNVSTAGLESSPVAEALAGLRANEARYFKNKYDHDFAVEPASNAKKAIAWLHDILKKERDLVIESPPLEATAFEVDNIRMAYVFYQSGLSINVMYTIDNPKKRAVGFKLSDGVDVPAELVERFKFARQKSKLAGTIRGSFSSSRASTDHAHAAARTTSSQRAFSIGNRMRSCRCAREQRARQRRQLRRQGAPRAESLARGWARSSRGSGAPL
jgi:hypothetical protein